MHKTIINQNIGGLNTITTLNLPDETVDREIVLFSGTEGDTMIGSGVIVSAQKDVAPVRSVTFGTLGANPGITTTIWVNSSDQKVYLGAEAVGPITLDPIGAAPNANGATMADGVLNLEPCNATNGGVISNTTQDIPGEKTFKQTVNTEGNFNLPTTSNAAGCLTMNDFPVLHNYPYHLASTYLGFDCGNFTNNGGGNIAAAGFGALKNITAGADNSAFGTRSGENLTSSSRCTLLGYGAGRQITSGCDSTICIGNEAGLSLVSNSNNCIIIANSGTLGDQNTIKIGANGTHTTCYLQGITGTTGTDEMVCVEPATGKLGRRALLSMGAIGASPNANGATISGQVLTMQPASASFGGIVTNGAQTLAGAKTLSSDTTFGGLINVSATSSATQGSIFAGSNRFISRPGTQNTFLGVTAGNFTGTIDNNVGIGYRALTAAGTTASSGSNVGLGSNCLNALTQGNQNVAGGYNSLGGLTNASSNTAFGDAVAVNLQTGSGNLLLGRNAGSAYTTNESNNILLANVGVIGDSLAIRIGSTQTSCAIAGISGRTSTSGVAVLVNASGVLGTTTSSARFKENISTLPDAISAKLNDLRIVQFNYKDDTSKKIQYGVIAEEAVGPFPEFAVYDNDDPEQPVNTFQYLNLIPLLVKELQVQKARIDELERNVVML